MGDAVHECTAHDKVKALQQTSTPIIEHRICFLSCLLISVLSNDWGGGISPNNNFREPTALKSLKHTKTAEHPK